MSSAVSTKHQFKTTKATHIRSASHCKHERAQITVPHFWLFNSQLSKYIMQYCMTAFQNWICLRPINWNLVHLDSIQAISFFEQIRSQICSIVTYYKSWVTKQVELFHKSLSNCNWVNLFQGYSNWEPCCSTHDSQYILVTINTARFNFSYDINIHCIKGIFHYGHWKHWCFPTNISVCSPLTQITTFDPTFHSSLHRVKPKFLSQNSNSLSNATMTTEQTFMCICNDFINQLLRYH